MSAFDRTSAQEGPPPNARNNILSTLKAIQMNETKPVLPAEIISTILDYLPVPDVLSFARTSKRMLEMVYEDSRWVQRLQAMGIWNEGEARKRFEDALRKKRELMRIRAEEEGKRMGIGVNGTAGIRKTSTTLFDAGVEEEKQKRSVEVASKAARTSMDGFETLTLSAHGSGPVAPTTPRAPMLDPEALLNIFSGVKSIRGSARQEYGRIYAALAPFYFDLARSKSHVDPVIFRVYRDPEQQAQMLAHLTVFSRSDWAQGWRFREERLNTMIGVFENAVLREFEQGYETWDINGKMRRYAHVLGVLNDGHAGIELFVQKHPIFSESFGNFVDCINQAASEGIALEPSREFLEKLSIKVNEQSDVISQVFPLGADVFLILLDKIAEDILMEYVTPLFDECHERSIVSYLKAVAGIFEQSMLFGSTLKPSKSSGEDFKAKVKTTIARVFEPHVDLYLQEEADYFKRFANMEVDEWEKKLTEQEATKESFYMGNFNRQADKKDFLSSFKKVVMMPVNVLPSIAPFGSPFATTKPSTSLQAGDRSSFQGQSPIPSPTPSRPETPSLGSNFKNRYSVPLPLAAPTDELAAKAALMASRLEGIRSLFSIEVALDLSHAAKASIERAGLFVQLGGQTGEEAREQCLAIFVTLLQILGNRHVKIGFDKAVDHLSKYNPREISEHQKEVAPLVTFLELVNVGDLISQMIDVFYEQQLVATKLTDRNDFLDPAVKAKKKFEQMLDERVAAGLNKGIDVLMDEVEYVCATLQKPTDYNPVTISEDGKRLDPDIGPTDAARRVVAIVESHTKMLTGSTDKNMLDVFNQEVGLRLFTALCKHLKRQRISTEGAPTLMSDMNLYFIYIRTLRNSELLEYFKALRELSQIYLIEAKHAKDLAEVIADGGRFSGVLRAEEVYEFAERRADWYQVKRDVERAMYGIGCGVM